MASGPHTTLTFLGAASTVTGSKYLLSVGERRILVDAGMFQGERAWRARNLEEFPTDPRTITDVVLTHAHMDHCGYLPALVRAGFAGPVWSTEGTRRLAGIVLRDAAHLLEQDAEEDKAVAGRRALPQPLYTADDVEDTLPLLTPVPYDDTVDLGDGIRMRLTRAGHILGAASVTVWTPTTSVVFSGDIGRATHPVLRPREVPPGGAFVLVESTYGDRTHPTPANLPHEGFADVVRRTIARGGSVLVLAFAIDRTELVLKTLGEFMRHGRIPEVPVYVNSPMASSVLDVYESMPEELRADLTALVDVPDLRHVRSADDSRRLTGDSGHGPAIIVSSSGMASGGRVLHHLDSMLPDPANAIVLTGYQAVGTRGRQLIEGAKEIRLKGRSVPVRAEVLQDSEFSVHADAPDIMAWLTELSPRPATVFCIHGEAASAGALAARIEDELGVTAVVPTYGQVVLLDAASPVSGAPEASGRPAGGAPAASRLRYRVLTASESAELSRLVSEALDEGYVLHQGPAVAFDGQHTLVAQAVVLPD